MIPAQQGSAGAAGRRWRATAVEAVCVGALLIAGAAIALGALRMYRAGGGQPRFYQENFGPAVMMACGRGFTAPAFHATPASLRDFLDLKRSDFSCGDLPSNLVLEQVTWNGTWYYLYGSTALVWRIAGISWGALDWLAAVFGGVVLAAQYALFRLVSGRLAAAIIAMILMLLPINLIQIPALRDYSKVPFVLLSIWALAWLVMRPMTWRGTLGMSVLFGAVVGFGYGFRTDVMIMAPFGFAVIAFLLPGSWRTHWHRNLAAVGVGLLTFLIVAAPPLRGLTTGGCQFHYSLLGLTSPLTRALGIETPTYAFGDHFLDTFVDLKVGDFADRVMGMGVPNLCDPNYDLASGQLFFGLARTFPADLIVRAYGAVLVVLHAGLQVPDLYGPLADIPWLSNALQWVHRQPDVIGALGPLVTLAAVGVAWSASARLGIALTVFVLFLAGYPAIEFESRHWFHLRFIPWWALLLLIRVLVTRRAELRRFHHWRRAISPVVVTMLLMALALAGGRLYQKGTASDLAQRYAAAPTEALTIGERSGSVARIEWRPNDVSPPPGHRGSDLLVVTIESSGCRPAGPFELRVAYEADAVSHDMSSTVRVLRGEPGEAPTRLFFPIFMQGHLDHTYLRFSAIEVPGGQTDCVSGVARVSDRKAIPIWVQMQLPPDWRDRPLHQSLRAPQLWRGLR